MTEPRLRLTLDQNFPMPLIDLNREYLPTDIDLVHIAKIDHRLSDLGDRQLFIALKQLGYDGLITNNYRMLAIPEEVAAIVKTKAVVVAVQALGHDPIRAVGALLLELPGLPERLRRGKGNVFRLNYNRRRPEDAWTYLAEAARRLGKDPDELWEDVKVTNDEMNTTVLS